MNRRSILSGIAGIFAAPTVAQPINRPTVGKKAVELLSYLAPAGADNPLFSGGMPVWNTVESYQFIPPGDQRAKS